MGELIVGGVLFGKKNGEVSFFNGKLKNIFEFWIHIEE